MLPVHQATRNMFCSEVCDEVCPRDDSIALVGLVGIVPAGCCTLKLEGGEGDVVDWSDGVCIEVILDLCDPIIRFQRVSSHGERRGVDSKELLQSGVLWSITPLGSLVLQ